jgi:uncharacterized protein YijF (DUF1287 family)
MLALALFALLPDRGIFEWLTPTVALEPPPIREPSALWLRFDPVHGVLTLYEHDDPLRAYGVHAAMSARVRADLSPEALDPADLAELRALVPPETEVRVSVPGPAEDHDGDGIVDALDILIGAKKLLQNRASYRDRYVSIPYPGGDVPRDEGVCSDTVIRALRNAGIDLQREVHEDLLRARSEYPMVRRVDASINHRRVHTLLRWFERHFMLLPPSARYRPGDIVFFDTFPNREGPDHLGVVGDRLGEQGAPFVINNWAPGYFDAEMDLLPMVPVTHHFRAPTPTKRAERSVRPAR